MTLDASVKIESPDGRTPIVFNWGVSSYFGWGLNGLNLALALSGHKHFYPLVSLPFDLSDCVVDPLRQSRLEHLVSASSILWDTLTAIPRDRVAVDTPVLIGLGHNLVTMKAAGGKTIQGDPTIGVVFIEHATLSPEAHQRANEMALIIAGSRWNEQVLRANNICATTTVPQGVDTALFHPGPRTGQFRDRFVIFSGGKLEFRKGQDLVVRAFNAFHQRHPEALLITAWGNNWEWRDGVMEQLSNTAPMQPGPDGQVDTARWAVDNGVPSHALIALGRTPNIAMAHVLREVDVAVFPNRCEGGTNLVAMECMASGVPVILSANTGHLDLLEPGGTALSLDHQDPVNYPDADIAGWGESSVDEILDRLEQVWTDRQAARIIADRAANFMATMTWKHQTDRLMRAILPLLP